LFLVRRCRIWIAADLVVAADHRVELAAACALGEVEAVLVERLALALGVLAADVGATAHGFDRGLQRLAREAVLFQQAAGLALVVGEREQEHLAGDELVAALLRFAVGDVEQVVEVAADADLAAVALDLGQAADGLADRVLERRHVDAGALQQRHAAAVVLLEQRLQHVQRLDELLVVAHGDALRIGQGLLELGGELVEAHGDDPRDSLN
jgi:hypothetical protein